MDSLTIAALCRELHAALEGGRIDKIYQPSDRDVIITVRSRRANVRLLLSANRAQPRAHLLFAARPANPEEPPMFCMILRKRLEGGRILAVRQLSGDRIISILMENTNELGDLTPYVMILEVMGKHSNLMVCEADQDGIPGRIIDSIVHVSPDVSRVRPVLPGFHYTPVPTQAKQAIDTLTPSHLDDLDLAGLESQAQVKVLTRTVAGIGPVTAREVLHRAQQSMVDDAQQSLEEASVQTLQQLVRDIASGRETPSLQMDSLGRPVAAAPYLLTHCQRFLAAESLNHALDSLFQAAIEIRQTSRLASDLSRAVTDTLDKLRGKLSKLNRQMEESVTHDDLRIKGELLTTYCAQIAKGVDSVTLLNYYDEEKPITIPLNPALTAIENAQRYFKQSRKRKRSIPILTAERATTEADLAYLDAVTVHLSEATPGHLQAIQDELIRQGFFRLRQRDGQRDGRKSNGKPAKKAGKSSQGTNNLPPDLYVSSEGFAMRVGRNNVQNDKLTLKSSQPHDIWLHVLNLPGSHVVIQTEKQEVPETTLDEAAILAAYFSKGRDSANVAVDYAPIRHVWKPNGARPGHVLYEGQKTRFVTPERSFVQSILARKG